MPSGFICATEFGNKVLLTISGGLHLSGEVEGLSGLQDAFRNLNSHFPYFTDEKYEQNVKTTARQLNKSVPYCYSLSVTGATRA